jgi:phosphate transport system substrate-binding protein
MRLALDARGFARRRLLGLMPAAACLWPGRPWANATGAEQLRIGGNGTGTTVLRRLFDDWPGVRFVPNLGSGGGLKALEAGAIDIAISARRLRESERSRGIIERELFRTPYAPAVHGAVTVRHLTLDQLTGFYAGSPAVWPDGAPVRLVLRPDHASETQALRALDDRLAAALGRAKARPGIFVATNANEAIAAIERIPGSLGITSLAMRMAEARDVHLLSLDGIEASLELLQAGRCPYYRTIHLMTRGAPDDRVAALTALFSDRRGAQALAALGCLATAAG